MFTIHEKDQNTVLPLVIGLKIWIEEVNERAREGGSRVALEHKDTEGRKAKERNDN